jgi:hypothetical protein
VLASRTIQLPVTSGPESLAYLFVGFALVVLGATTLAGSMRRGGVHRRRPSLGRS